MHTAEWVELREQKRTEMLERLANMGVRVERAMDGGELSTEEGITLMLKIEAQIAALSGVGMYPAF